jgi:hypothetical protein
MSRERKTGPRIVASKHFTISIKYLIGLHVIRSLAYDYRPVQFQSLNYHTV